MRRDLARVVAMAATVACVGGATREACAQDVTAANPGLLPAYGADVRVGDLRTQFARTFDTDPQTRQDRLWTFTPALDVSETYDSAARTDHGYAKDFITRVTPVLAGAIDASRVTGVLNYSPTFSLYALNGNQSGVTHNLNTNATATLVEDLLYADLRGYAATQPILGGLVTPGSVHGSRDDQEQTASFTVSPYLQKRFGDTATVLAGYSATRSIVDTLGTKAATPLVSGVNSSYTSQQENASVAAGPDFGRITGSLSAIATQYDGAGLYRGAHNESVTAAAGYAITRMITLTASLGHENIVYGPGGPKKIDDITWSGGVRLTPNADSTITISYGHQQGSTAFSFNGSYAASQRVHLLARYSQGIGTGLQNLQSALAGTVVGPAGVTVDRATNAPVQLGGLLGMQPGVYRTTDGSVSTVVSFARDTVTVSFDDTTRTLLSSPSTTSGGYGSNSGMTGTVAWQHLLSEALTTNTTLQYGTQTILGATGGSNATEAASMSVNYALSQTLSTNGLVSHSETKGRTFGLPPTHDLAVLGLHKAF